VDVCPVDCIIGGQPEADWPWFYIDPDTCIDCGACIPECPYEAIFEEELVPEAFEFNGEQVRVPHTTKEETTPEAGKVVDLTQDIQPNYDFYIAGPGYEALEMA
jgi:NAD-dependent dihydropyrimidine dehydrogenase PreA subunit